MHTRTNKLFPSQRLIACLGALILLLSSTATHAEDIPEVFFPGTVSEAFEAALPDNKFVIVFACADWNAQSRQMDRVVWTDPRIVQWINEHAIAVRLDADKDAAVVRQFKLKRFPGLLLFKGSSPRPPGLPGYRTADNVLSFLEGAFEYERTGIQRENLSDQIAGPNGALLPNTMIRAQAMIDNGELEDAATIVHWLWDNMVPADSAFAGVRRTLLTDMIQSLVRQHEPSAEYFGEVLSGLRDSLERNDATWSELRDWIVISNATGRETDVIEWAQDLLDSDDGPAVLRRAGASLPPILIDAGRLDIAAAIVSSPAEAAERGSLMLDIARRSPQEAIKQLANTYARELAIEYYVLALYADKQLAEAGDDANTIARRLFVADSDVGQVRRQLTRAALEYDLVNTTHESWIASLPQTDENVELLEQIRAALGTP